jgi:hypothetical protein
MVLWEFLAETNCVSPNDGPVKRCCIELIALGACWITCNHPLSPEVDEGVSLQLRS